MTRKTLAAAATALLLVPSASRAAEDHWILYQDARDGVAKMSDGDWTFKVLANVWSGSVEVQTCLSAPEETSALDFSKSLSDADGSDAEKAALGMRKEPFISSVNTLFSNPWGETSSVGREKVGSVLLPDTGLLEQIRTGAFYNCVNLESVAPFLPDSVTTVQSFAFGNTAVTNALRLAGIGDSMGDATYFAFSPAPIPSVEFGDDVTTIGDLRANQTWAGHFENCDRLTNVVFGAGLRNVGNKTFKGCTALESVSLGAIERINDGAFQGCTAIRSLALGGALAHVGDSAFQGCSALSLVEPLLPASVTNVGASAFLGTGVAGALALEGAVSVGKAAFKGTGITSATLGRNVKTLGGGWESGAFCGCASLTTVAFHRKASGVELGECQFYGCAALAGELDLSCAASIGRWMFTGTQITNLVFGAGMDAVGERAFASAPATLRDVWWRGPAPANLGSAIFYFPGARITHHVNRAHAASWTALADEGTLVNGAIQAGTTTWTSTSTTYLALYTPVDETTVVVFR